MNFYFTCFIVVLSLGVLVSPSQIYPYISKIREVKIREETTRKLNENDEFPIKNGLVRVASQVRSWTQWMRKLLKALRKWWSLHPPEVKLGKCFARYFSFEIPGFIRYKKISRFTEGINKTEYSREMSRKLKIRPGDFGECPTASQIRTFNALFLGKIIVFLLRNFLLEIKSRHFLSQFYDFIFKNELLACALEYFWKKFWIWVDSAPDALFNV